MHHLRHSTLGSFLASGVASLTLIAVGLAWVSPLWAQKINQATSTAVMPFADLTGHTSQLVADKATDAVALALEDSQDYVVTTKADTRREMEALGIIKAESPRFTVSDEQMVRLGERLRVEKVANGSVDLLAVEKTGRCRCVLTVRLLDVDTQTYLDGATADYTTKPIPGWQGEDADVINEALRSAAEVAVSRIQTARRPRGNVDMVDQAGEIIVNLGYRDGIEVGMELLAVRGVWNAPQERVVMRNVGVISVKSTEINMCRCRLLSGSMPRTSDKTYVMYRPNTEIAKAARNTRLKKFGRIGMALALGLGMYGVATGSDHQSAPGVSAYLSQASPGAEPRIRVVAGSGSVPDSAKIFAWLVFRGETAGFPAEIDNRNYLIAAHRGGTLDNFEDDPPRVVDIEFDLEFQFLDEDGEQEDGNFTATYNHLPLTAGRSYYYKLRRVVDPGRVRIPIADTEQEEEEELAEVDWEIDPADSLSLESNPAGPITFFYPPTLETPSDGNGAVDWRADSTVFTWKPSTGADQYRVLIYTNPQATGTPIKQSEVCNYTGTSTTMNWRLNAALASSTTYYWFVAAWKSGETAPRVTSAGTTGYVLSSPYEFTTVSSPPSTPTAAKSTTTGRPGRSNWWGGRRLGR